MRRLTRPFAALTLTIALGACVAGPVPEIATPAPELSSEYLYAPDGATAASLDTLMPSQDAAYIELAAKAIEQAPSLAEAAARIEAARAGARGAGANRLPNVSAEAAVTGTRINPNQFGEGAAQGGFIDTEQVSYGANLVASWDIDLFGRLKAQKRAAVARIDAANASAAGVRVALLSEIAGSVIDWRTLEARMASINEDVTAAQQLARLAKVREDAGIAPGFDRVRAEAAASASRSRQAALDSERVRIVGRLVTLTGLTGTQVTAALEQDAAFTRPAPAPATLPSELLANRPDVVAAASELTATDSELAAAARARFPSINLSAVVGLLAFNPSNFFDEDSIVGSLAAGIAGPLLDFGRIGAEIDGAAANKKLAFASYRGAVFQALGDAETAYGLIEASDNEAALAMRERDELQRAAGLANTRYRAGLADFLTVLEARRAADASGERAAAALGRAQRARVLLWQALGGDGLTS
ncbi:MAG: efflux transporter outer membrane subunit [Pseudomonadota bacterium]